MKRMGWGSGKGQANKGFQNVAEEVAALMEAQEQGAWVMNDDVVKAQEALSLGTTPFHKLGYGAALFWQAVLGFEKPKMNAASAALADAESAAAEYKKAATAKNPATFHSKIYPDGAAYAVCEAQCQLLGAVLGILKESWLESLAGLNKLRKAYFCIHDLYVVEQKYLKLHPPAAQSRVSLVSNPTPSSRAPPVSRPTQQFEDDDDDSDDDFVDAVEGPDGDGSFSNGYVAPAQPDIADLHIGSTPSAKRTGSILSTTRSNRSTKSSDAKVDFRLVTTEPMELFVHSSVNMCWGILQIVLSLLPPAFRHLLAMFSFRGDRDNGLNILWETTNYKDNIFGSIASMVILLYHNIAVSLADILPHDAVPEARIKTMLGELRALYPQSQLWINEEARIAVANHQIEKAVQILSKPPSGGSFPELQGIRVFELGLNLMFLHRFQECADTFVYCCQVNKWSHGMYYYIAAMSYVELYRDNKRSNPGLAKKYADKAKDILHSNDVATYVKRKALLGQQLPFDAFIQAKLEKWEARVKTRKCDFIDAIGVSPIEEFCYFWTGYRRMTPQQAQIHLSRLLTWEATEEWADETIDERASSAVLRGICLRILGRTADAKELFEKGVLCYTAQQIKSVPNATNYPIPVARYEKGVCLWIEAGGEGGNMNLLRLCKEEVDACYNASSWILEDRMVVKLGAARETFKALGI